MTGPSQFPPAEGLAPTPPDGTAAMPTFDDDEVVARAVAETNLPESKVRAVVEAQAWYLICAGVMGVTGGDAETKAAEYHARFPWMFDRLDEDVPQLSYEDEATFIAETTDIFEDESTRILASVRAYECAIGVTDRDEVDDYRAWRAAWLTYEVRPRVAWVDGKPVFYSFAEAILREQRAGA